MTPIALLLSLFDDDTDDVSLAALEDEVGADAVQGMLARSLFEAGAKMETAPCLACEQPGHLVRVRWDDVAGSYQAWCPSVTQYTYPASACETLRFSPTNFAREIGRALNVQEWRERWVIDNVLMHVGTAQLGFRSWSLFLGRNLRSADTFAAVLRRNIEGVGYESGMIIGSLSPDMSPEQNKKLHHQFRVADDLLIWQSGGIVERPGAIRHYLARSPASAYVEPTESIVHRILREQVGPGGTLPSGPAFRALIKDYWPSGRDLPERTQLYKYRKSFAPS